MSQIESILLTSARFALEPFRAVARGHQQMTGRSPLTVMFYHRVADTSPNPWTITTSAFRAQLEWLIRNFEIISLDECQQRIRSGFNSRPAVAITFDDGYAENCEVAIPWLVERQIPFTYYVALNHVLSGRPFPHDLERGESLPVDTIETVRALADAGVEIGSHTWSHADLGKTVDDAQLRHEIAGSTAELSRLIGRPVRHFAFPYGRPANVSPEAVRIARECGLQSVATAWNGVNTPGDDPFHIARVHGDPCLARVQNWLSGDRRLVHRRMTMDRSLGMCPVRGVSHS